MNIYNNILKLLIVTPFFFAFSGMLIIPSGDKKMAVALIIGTLSNLIYAKVNGISLKNRLRNPYLIIILITTTFSIFSYYYHGTSSREMRALIVISIFLSSFPLKKINESILIIILIVGAVFLFSNTAYYNLLLDKGRWVGHINPIPYSTICAAIGIVSYSFLLSTQNTIKKVIFLLVLLFSIYPLIVSQSRGVWLALLVGLTITSFIHFKSKKFNRRDIVNFILISISVSVISVFFLKNNISNRVEKTLWEIENIESGDFSTSIGLRLQMWLATPHIIKENILIGNGDKHQIIIKNLYNEGEISSSLYKFNPTHYHNQFLDKLVKSGVVGFIIFIALITYPLTLIKKVSERSKLIIYGVLSIYIIASLTDVPFNHPQTLIIFMLILFPVCIEGVEKHHD